MRSSPPVPHSGYHWDSRQHPFFEGWYYRLTLPDSQSIAFMYSLQDPKQPTLATGGAVQILGPDEQYFCRALPDVATFWAWKHNLGHGQRRHGAMEEGYEATATVHKGQFWDPATHRIVRWHYAIEPIYTWGTPTPKSTAGWMSHLQIFEPGWQVLMAHGLATGWFEWAPRDIARQAAADLGSPNPTNIGGCGAGLPRRFEFTQVPAYAEKNWGGAFPKKWFWIQCNAFEHEPDLSITCGGGIRQTLGFQESVGMVGIHHQGQFYEFVPWNGQITWQVSPWGHWRVWAEQPHYRVEIVGHTDLDGVRIQVPTAHGLQYQCRDTTRGILSINLWQKRRQLLILGAHSNQAGLEVGGDWKTEWTVGPRPA
ncbi:tocopherol cyclase family protein [Leptothoe kymatousa]|uniref:Tocopherol cyclase family protein n=1 Tax=Leptothoe kymatousa TAU-MAC 1615 TaxID=2364775 RepID=A0ABS5Y1J3_9CYAN|nr:tocopherol cyclase family protein [Leptothoe kymatousa]MBT9311688.1 tocopherol cyclase family protein [Leptothoe kymatousa TAU-MAC 1615]